MQWRDIKVRPDTFSDLLRSKAAYEFRHGKRLSMDGLLKIMIASLPKVNISIEPQRGSTEEE